ncbi:tipN [uncultured Brevundimonas sp.]|uniref:tipN n=1 Tax=uncultured Brevundimonas sp. TaxID=213418 RepID=UPI0025D80481|nr:tipN [uncultured Brevundimonas sp.]
MKSRMRPPLKLTEDEPPASAELSPPIFDRDDQDGPVQPASRAPADPGARAAPMSERQRRRLMEQQAAPPPAAQPLATADIALPPDTAPAPYQPPVTARASRRRQDATVRQAYIIAGVASALWIGGIASLAAYEFGSNGQPLDPLRIAVYLLIALAPVGLALMLAHIVRQGAGLAAESRRARELSDALVAPTALAAQQTGQVLQTLRADIDNAALTTERARADMALLREALAEETLRLNEAAETAGRTARRLGETLGRERDQMQTLSVQLDSQSAGVLDAVERQSRMVVDASDLAQTQLREAEALLAARAADLAAAAGEAQDAARLASDDLARQTLRLENAGSGVAEQIQLVEEGLGQQRAALVTTAYALRTDQEDFSAQVESQRAQLVEQLSASRAAAGELGGAARASAESMRELIEAASDQLRALVEMSQREADGFDSATKLALDRFESLAAEARDSLVEETRRSLEALQATAEDSRTAAAEAAEQARHRVDRLGESLFEAAQRADQAADARIEEARRVVGETAGLVDQAGEQAVERLEVLLERMNATLEQVDAAFAEIDQRAARLPEDARAHVKAVRASVEEGLASLTAASRKAAEDNEALEAGFQERVRRNYDMLNEAVRLMSVVSGDGAARRRDPAAAEPERTPPRPPAPDIEPVQAERRAGGLRGRLGLARPEPTEPSAPTPLPPLPPYVAPPTGGDDVGLDWQDLISDGEPETPRASTPAEPPDAALGERMIASVRRMGIDPNALLPRSRIEEAARAIGRSDPAAARHIVRRVAPAAVRSVSRRVLGDPELRSDAERYVRGFAGRLADTARGGDVADVQAQLTTDEGRAFMLLDAAVGDVAG